MAKRDQFRNHSLISYCSVSQIEEVLHVHSHQIKAYAYCLHDCDVDDLGGIKSPHIHILFLLFSPISPSTVRNWFSCVDELGNTVNTLDQKIVDISASFRYLIHEDNPEKYQYLPEMRICSDIKYFADFVDDDVSKLALFDLLDGVPLREVAFRYGRDFIYHYGHIKQIYIDILSSESPSLEGNFRKEVLK